LGVEKLDLNRQEGWSAEGGKKMRKEGFY